FATPAALLMVARKLLSSRARSSSAGSSCLRSLRPPSVKNKYPARPPTTAPTIAAAIAREFSITTPPLGRSRLTPQRFYKLCATTRGVGVCDRKRLRRCDPETPSGFETQRALFRLDEVTG